MNRPREETTRDATMGGGRGGGGGEGCHRYSALARAGSRAHAHTHNSASQPHGSQHVSMVWRVYHRFTERRGKKTVRFDGGTNVGGSPPEEWSWEADRQGSQDSATKDSGIDTSSTFTSSEDSNRGDLPKVRAQEPTECHETVTGNVPQPARAAETPARLASSFLPSSRPS